MALTEFDRTLIQRCLELRPGSWEDFVDRFAGLIYHVIRHTANSRSVTLSPDDCDDLCADVFLEILSRNFTVLRRFRGSSSLATYLAVVARRVVMKKLLDRQAAEAMGHTQAHQAVLNQAGVTNAEIQRIDDRELVERMLSGLSPTEASIVRMFHLEGRSYGEISKSEGVPENSIGPTLSRAREQLRRNLTAR